MTNPWEPWEWHSLRDLFHGIMGGLHWWCCVVSHDTAPGLATCFSCCWCAILGGYIISAEVQCWSVGGSDGSTGAECRMPSRVKGPREWSVPPRHPAAVSFPWLHNMAGSGAMWDQRDDGRRAN